MNESAVSRMAVSSSRSRPSRVRKCRNWPSRVSCKWGGKGSMAVMSGLLSGGLLLPGFLKLNAQRIRAAQFYPLMGIQRKGPGRNVGLDGQLPGTEVDQCGQYDTRRTAVIEDLVHRRTDG